MNNTTETTYTIPELSPALERGPVWLREKRRSFREAFNATPLPRRGLHLWRYTDPSKFLLAPTAEGDTVFDEDYDAVVKLERQHVDDGHLAALVVDYGGREIVTYGIKKLAESGILIMPLSEAVDSHHHLVEQYLYGLVNEGTGKFEAMNGALWNDGVFVYIPDNTILEKPIHLLREAGTANTTVYPRLLAVIGKNAEATIIDEYGGGGNDRESGLSNCNSVVELYGLEHSRVRYVPVQRHGGATSAYLTHRASVAAGASMTTIPLAFGALVSKANYGAILNGAGADSKMYGLLFGSGRQHLDNHTLHHHAHGQTTSDIDFKVVLRDRAVSAYTGLIRIDRHAKTCEAYQENRNLLLTPGCKAETIPELEILNEDVSCSHGATIGPIDPMSIFYLTSRGIAHDIAVRMIVSGFVRKTLTTVPADLQERISEFVQQRLEDI